MCWCALSVRVTSSSRLRLLYSSGTYNYLIEERNRNNFTKCTHWQQQRVRVSHKFYNWKKRGDDRQVKLVVQHNSDERASSLGKVEWVRCCIFNFIVASHTQHVLAVRSYDDRYFMMMICFPHKIPHILCPFHHVARITIVNEERTRKALRAIFIVIIFAVLLLLMESTIISEQLYNTGWFIVRSESCFEQCFVIIECNYNEEFLWFSIYNFSHDFFRVGFILCDHVIWFNIPSSNYNYWRWWKKVSDLSNKKSLCALRAGRVRALVGEREGKWHIQNFNWTSVETFFQVNEAIRIQFSIVLSSICWSIRIFEFNSVINESFHGSSSDAWSTSCRWERGWPLFSVDNVVKIQISSFLQDHLCCRT